jgi:hypothetical protein
MPANTDIVNDATGLLDSLVSIIILNYNGKGVVEQCVESVLRTSYKNFEIIIVDNASTDGSREALQEIAASNSRVQLIVSKTNLGFAGGNNLALRYCKGKYIVLLNSDTVVTPSWLNDIVHHLYDPSNAIVQSKLVFLKNPRILESAGGFIDRCGFGLERGYELDDNRYTQSYPIFYANGASMGFKKEIVDKLYPTGQLFDEDYFYSYEDVDLSWRAILAGYQIIFTPNSLVYHRRGIATSRHPWISTFHHSKNRIMTLIKNYSTRNVFKYVPLLILLEVLRAVQYLLSGKGYWGISIFRAIIWNAYNFKKNWQKHMIIQQIRRIDEKKVLSMMPRLNPALLIHNMRKYRILRDKYGILLHE